MLAGKAIHDVVERASRHRPDVKLAMAEVERAAPHIREVINEVAAALAVRAVPRSVVTEEFEKRFPKIFRAAVVQGAHDRWAVQTVAGRMGSPPAKGAKGVLPSMAEKALFIAALENAIDEVEEQTAFNLSSAISELSAKLEHLRPEGREDMQELNQMLEVLQSITQSTHQMNLESIRNMR